METIRRTVNNMSLKQKLLFIMLMGVSMIASVSFLSIYILSSTYNRLLYRSMSETMSYSAKEITDYLSKMENLTELFLSDDEVQKTLVSLTNAQESGDKAPNLVREAGICVQNYYFNNADGILKYITLYTQASVIRTNLIVAGEVPEEIQQLLRQKAQQKDGAPSWTDDYMNEYGLFLSRTVRKIDGLELAPLGTILLEIDMNQLVKASTNFEQQYGNPMYVIRAKGQELYHTANLSEEAMETIAFETIDQYDIRTIDGSSYFITHGSIPKFGWDYYCLVSYEEVRDKIMNVQWVCIGLTIFVFAAIVGLTTNLTGKLLIHISSLKERMKRFAEDNMSVPAPLYDYTDRQDELGILNRQFDEMSRTIISLIRENYVNELLKKEAQVKALENQINPHFLYNTLDSIKWRAKSAGEKDISDMVEALGRLLRTTLSRKNDANYTVGKEMEVITAYITIQKMRYEDRLQFENHIESRWYAQQIPRLILQPLVENAIFYGVEMEVDACRILLDAEKKGNRLSIYVRNTGSEMEEDLLNKLRRNELSPQGNGVGLLNIDDRIKIRYGESYGLRLYNEREYAVAELVIPAECEGEGDATADCR